VFVVLIYLVSAQSERFIGSKRQKSSGGRQTLKKHVDFISTECFLLLFLINLFILFFLDCFEKQVVLLHVLCSGLENLASLLAAQHTSSVLSLFRFRYWTQSCDF